MKRLRLVALVSTLLVLTGCYAASVDTGRPPSNKVIKKAFAACWLYGLIPPSTVQTAAECPNGVSKVETKLSFVNMLVGNLTLGIFTPMQIVVTCAEAGKMGHNDLNPNIVVPRGAGVEEIQAAFALAADRSVKTQQPVYVVTAVHDTDPGESAAGTR